MLYDPSLFYGHNEFEIGMWRTFTVPFAESYREQYFRCIPPGQPEEECDDRNRLDSHFYHTSLSAHWSGASEEVRARSVHLFTNQITINSGLKNGWESDTKTV